MGLTQGSIPSNYDVWQTGDLKQSLVAAAQTGWLLCDGSAVSRTTYAALYAALGGASSPYGQGDGTTTFNVPDFRGRTLYGVGTHADVNALGDSDGLAVASRTPNHTHGHTLTLPTHSHNHSLTLPNHTHSNTIAVTSSGSHSATFSLTAGLHGHSLGGHAHSGTTGNPASGGFGAPAGAYAAAAFATDHTHGFSTGGPNTFANESPGVSGTINVLNHTHTLSGSVGNPATNPAIGGTVDSNSTSPAISGAISAGTAPYATAYVFIKT